MAEETPKARWLAALRRSLRFLLRQWEAQEEGGATGGWAGDFDGATVGFHDAAAEGEAEAAAISLGRVEVLVHKHHVEVLNTELHSLEVDDLHIVERDHEERP